MTHNSRNTAFRFRSVLGIKRAMLLFYYRDKDELLHGEGRKKYTTKLLQPQMKRNNAKEMSHKHACNDFLPLSFKKSRSLETACRCLPAAGRESWEAGQSIERSMDCFAQNARNDTFLNSRTTFASFDRV
jgi:hypothetical protein